MKINFKTLLLAGFLIFGMMVNAKEEAKKVEVKKLK